MQRFFKQFSFPGGIGSLATPETPGSLHEGGELGYSLSHAFGTVYDHPNLIALTMIGDGESETGPLATSWHGNKFLNPRVDGAVLPVLHLSGIPAISSGPSCQCRIQQGTPQAHREMDAVALEGHRRMPVNQVANGGTIRKPLRMPDFQDYAVEVEPGVTEVSSLSNNVAVFLRDVMAANLTKFRLFGPDETER
ncbi:hypothetical protein QFC24_005784 [Naganishia onofrii]|uniref:Uncharacterized protein n=1 Tax=Naganishia onofrii TaxID=1851511 RepID=A0ACC2X6R7_9TREE|nr:hypothetical protein QFC24_005784 [Naganishia onofrii]